MRPEHLALFACPACQGELLGDADDAAELACLGCAARYPIREGVPRFPVGRDDEGAVTRRTADTYHFAWRRFGRSEIEDGWEKDSYHYAELIPRDLMSGQGKTGLDAGCGGGADLLRLASGEATLIGVDISEGAAVASRMTRHLPNVQVAQADLHQLPFRPGTFDFIYSFGVLHHLPDPAAALRRLTKLLKPGGCFITYLYEDFSDRSWPERMLLAIVRGIRVVTSRLPKPALYVLC